METTGSYVMAESSQNETDEKIAYGKMQIKMASALFVRRLAFRQTNGRW